MTKPDSYHHGYQAMRDKLESTAQDRFHAWRHNSTDARPLYVEWIGNGQQRGDRYSYTTDEAKAKPMTAHQCRAFCSYMKECGVVGFWSQHPLEKKP